MVRCAEGLVVGTCGRCRTFTEMSWDERAMHCGRCKETTVTRAPAIRDESVEGSYPFDPMYECLVRSGMSAVSDMWALRG